MRDQLFLISHRVRLFLVSLGIVALAAPGATASLKKYDWTRSQLLHYSATSPHVEYQSQFLPGSKAIIDESSGDPVLRKLVVVSGAGGGLTVVTPALSGGFIWFNQEGLQGPANNQTGTGSTASSIVWGDTTGWTITGGTWCHAIPSYICSLALAVDQATLPNSIVSTHYDLGTWTFHGTGFGNSGGFVHRTGNNPPEVGNLQWFARGTLAQDGTVPALPLLGLGAVGVSVFAMGVASVRRRRE